MKGKRVLALVTTVAVLAALAGIGLTAVGVAGCRPKPQSIWSRPDPAGLPDEVRQWVEMSLPLDAGQARNIGEGTYLLLTYGPQPEGAAAEILDVARVTPGGQAITVTAKYTPAPSGTAGSGPARPYDLVLVSFATTDVTWVLDGNPNGHVMQVLDPLQPIVAASRWIKLFTPAPGATVSSPFTMSGLASVFEGTVNFRVLDASGQEIVPIGWSTGAMGDWGLFTKDIEYVLPAGLVDPASGWAEATLEVFWISAEDGAYGGVIVIPLRLLPPGS
jgi:hypothetical protein